MTSAEEMNTVEKYEYLRQALHSKDWKGAVRHDDIKKALYIKNNSHKSNSDTADVFVFTEREIWETREILQYTRKRWLSFPWKIDQEIFPEFLDSSISFLPCAGCFHLRWEYVDIHGVRRPLPDTLLCRLMAEKSEDITDYFKNGAIFFAN